MQKVSVCLVGCRGESNLGSVLRLMENFQAGDLFLVEARTEVTEVVASYACHAQSRIAKIRQFDTLASALQSEEFDLVLAMTAKYGQSREVLSLDTFAEESSLRARLSSSQKILLIFGREDVGLHSSELHFANFSVFIPVSEVYPVLNLSHAVSIVLYEVQRTLGRKEMQPIAEPLATSPEIHAIEESLDSFLQDFGYYGKAERHYHKGVLRQILRAHPYTKSQIRFCHGILRAWRNRRVLS
ncbi:MAG: hypothetical protein H3C47_13420 [Candidatus Cloacimonetes bacterium]|nr:hypothetical protein [Candidatus Cloacimonadota bacterium]